jgi:hypothetical protein
LDLEDSYALFALPLFLAMALSRHHDLAGLPFAVICLTSLVLLHHTILGVEGRAELGRYATLAVRLGLGKQYGVAGCADQDEQTGPQENRRRELGREHGRTS